MKWIIFIFLNSFVLVPTFAQKHDYQWLLGQRSQTNIIYSGTTIDFATNPPDIYYEFRDMFFSQANASMCDTAGNLLFYTNGIYIANALHEPMENGTGLAAGPEGVHNQGLYGYILTQGVMILPVPEHSSLYCILHTDKYFTPNQTSLQSSNLFFSMVDMTLQSGLGEVTTKNKILLSDALDMGRLTATHHANGRDWWLLLRGYGANLYHRILLELGGSTVIGQQQVGQPIPSNAIGQSVFSPDGSMYACVHLTGSAGNPIYVSIYDFDRCSGELSNPVQFTYADTASCGGIAISPNNRFLYVSSFRYVYQYDLHAGDIEASRITVAEWDGFFDSYPNFSTTFYLMQLAPDGKIYINSNNSTRYLHVINHPDLPGALCDVCQHCIELPSVNALSLPNFPNYRLQHLEGSPCDTLREPPVAEWEYEPQGLEIDFEDASFHDIRLWHWNFGDGAMDTVPNPVHSYAAEGVYNVCLAVSNPRGADTLCREVQVLVSSAGFDSAQPATAVRVWPNPLAAGQSLTISGDGIPPLSTLILQDVLGRKIYREVLHPAEGRPLHLSAPGNLPPGVYLYSIESGATVYGHGKIVIQ
jgi:PKD repeat protein